MPTYIPGISATGTLASGLTPAAVRAVLELLSSAEIAAAYLPLAGGTMAGNLDMDHYQISNVQAIDSDEITLNGLPVASEQYASNASNLTTGTVPDARLSANVARRDQANTFAAELVLGGTTTGIVGTFISNNSNIAVMANGAIRTRLNIYSFEAIRTTSANTGLIFYTNVGAASGGAVLRSPDTTKFRINNLSDTLLDFECASVYVGASDVRLVRNATGPTAETRAAGGLRVCNADGSAVGPVQCSTITIPYASRGLIDGSSNSSGADYGFGGPRIGATASYQAGSGAPVSPMDTFMSRAGSGVWQIGTTSNNALGSLNLANLTASGVAKFNGYPTGLLPAAASNAGSITYDTTLAKHVGCNGSSWNALW